MAAPLLYQVKFEADANMPAIETILLDVMEVTGLVVVATSRVASEKHIAWELAAKQKGKVLQKAMHTALLKMGDVMQNSLLIIGNHHDKKASYLIGSLLFVLTRLGGVYKGPLPDWVGKNWQTVRARTDWREINDVIWPAESE